jgi:hypothetical protein
MRESIEVDFEGKTYTVTYLVEKGMINVGCAFDSKWAKVGATPPLVLARIIGMELLMEAKRKGLL